MTKQSYQIIIYNKSLYLSSPEPFLTKITAQAQAKYGGSTAPGSGSATLLKSLRTKGPEIGIMYYVCISNTIKKIYVIFI